MELSVGMGLLAVDADGHVRPRLAEARLTLHFGHRLPRLGGGGGRRRTSLRASRRLSATYDDCSPVGQKDDGALQTGHVHHSSIVLTLTLAL